MWSDSLVAGQPSMRCVYPVTADENLADISANALLIIFGDFKRLYEAIVISETRITRDEVTTPGYVKFYIRQRIGRAVVDDHAAKVIKCAAS
jgi:HK97 family phage major capsid protein